MAQPSPIHLRGVTWKHTRGLLPMLATAQRYEETHPGVQISWETRSLQSFADEPLESLAGRFDLLVIDHPSCGRAEAGGFLLPLEEHIPEEFLRDQAEHSVGQSYRSYLYKEHLWALPIDAATPVSLRRPDLLARAGCEAPRTWEDLLRLAEKGMVLAPGLAIDSLMHFFMLCSAVGEEPFSTPDRVVDKKVGGQAMCLLRELLQLCPRECMDANPIAIWNRMAAEDRAAYCPFAYGYSNYSRRGYAEHVVEAGELVTLFGQTLCSTLGGAGMAISRSCAHLPEALDYAQFVASPQCQSTLYFDAGGQPGHRAAWLDAEVNRRAENFFLNTLPVLDRAWVRPRFDGYLEFQHDAGLVLHMYLREGGSQEAVMAVMNELASQAGGSR